MEYEKIYNDAYLKAHVEVENYIKTFLTDEKNAINYFSENFNCITTKLGKEYDEEKFRKTEPFEGLYVEFYRGKQNITKDKINNSFHLKVLPLFNEKKELTDYTFEQLIKEIAIFEAKREALRIFSNNRILFEMIYVSEDYSRFEIKDYDQVLENTEIFIYYDKIVYPHKYELKKEVQMKVEKGSQNNNYSNLHEEFITIELTDKEIALTMYILINLLKTKKKIPKTEIYKCFSMITVKSINSYENINSYKSTFQYKILHETYENINFRNLKDSTQNELQSVMNEINSLRKKIKTLKMINFNKELNLFYNKLSSLLKIDK